MTEEEQEEQEHKNKRIRPRERARGQKPKWSSLNFATLIFTTSQKLNNFFTC